MSNVNFSGQPNMTWSVQDTDIVTYNGTVYQDYGIDWMLLSVEVNSTTVGGDPAWYLRIKVPLDRIIRSDRTIYSKCVAKDNGVDVAVDVILIEGSNVVRFKRATGSANWSPSTNNTRLFAPALQFALMNL